MVKSIRDIEIALGSNDKQTSDSKKPNMSIARKSIVTNCEIQKGEIFTENNLIIKRPGSGVSTIRWDEILGSHASKNYAEDELI